MILALLPNAISVGRMILIAPILWAMHAGRFDLALWLFLAAGVSDAVDGIVAKQFGWASELGGRLDAAADKLLLATGFTAAWWFGLIPTWLLVPVLVRDLVIVIGVVIYHYRFEPVEPQPSVLSKINTFSQIVCVLLAMFAQTRGGLDPVLMQTWFVITLLTTVFSGIDYLWTFTMRAWRLRTGRA